MHANIMVKFQQRYQMRHRNSRSEDLCRGGASAVYEPVGSTPSPPHSLSGGMIALNHPNRSVNPREFLRAEKEDQEMAEACHFGGSPKSENPIYQRG